MRNEGVNTFHQGATLGVTLLVTPRQCHTLGQSQATTRFHLDQFLGTEDSQNSQDHRKLLWFCFVSFKTRSLYSPVYPEARCVDQVGQELTDTSQSLPS